MNDPLLKIFALSPFPGFYAKLLREFPDLNQTRARRLLHRKLAALNLPHNTNEELEATHRYLRDHFVSILELQ